MPGILRGHRAQTLRGARHGMAQASQVKVWIKRVVPWLVAAGLLAYVFHAVPFSRMWGELRRVGFWGVFVFSVIYFVYAYAADVLATWATFRWFCAPLKLWDVVLIRGATYLLAMVNYTLGQGGIIYIVGRRHGVGVARATGTVLLTMGVMLVALLLLGGIGSYLGDPHDARLRMVRIICTGGLAAFALYLVVIAIRPGFLARRALLQPLFDAGILGTFKAFLVRFPHVVGHVVFQWILLRMFHVDLPFAAAATLLPVVFVIAWLPITVQGLGTQQVAAMELIGKYATGATLEEQRAQIVAWGLTVTAVFVVYSILTGLCCLRGATALAAAPPPGDAGASAADDAPAPSRAGESL
ncbi:MAG: flippase-like domain-containing protein [Deltaproteobacteria bacterium]|nr:flippase-like domain-containing protein [Deltaproteobacteria bacterium]